MKRFLYITICGLLPMLAGAHTISMPEYTISNEQFAQAMEEAWNKAEVPSYLPEGWILNGYVYLEADYGYNGRQTPVVDTTMWYVVLMYDGGICDYEHEEERGVVPFHGRSVVLDQSLINSGLFTATGNILQLEACERNEYGIICDCSLDDVPAFINYDMPAAAGASTEGFMIIGKPIHAECLDKDTIYSAEDVDVQPTYLEGEAALQELIDSKRRLLLKDGDEIIGTYELQVAIIVEADGSSFYTRVLQSSGNHWVDIRAGNIFWEPRVGKVRWTPGLVNGNPVRTRIIRTVVFDRPNREIMSRYD